MYLLRTEAVAIWRPDRLKATALMTEVPASIPMMIFSVDVIAGPSRLYCERLGGCYARPIHLKSSRSARFVGDSASGCQLLRSFCGLRQAALPFENPGWNMWPNLRQASLRNIT
ncbi:hypothetical protein AJ87_39880 [Rhizobium yanglingense]|nr:hypothetical protein AJ87_39880 [Rhizobium yanglingense]